MIYIGGSRRCAYIRYGEHKENKFDGKDYPACILMDGHQAQAFVLSIWPRLFDDFIELDVPGMFALSLNRAHFSLYLSLMLVEHTYVATFESTTKVTMEQCFYNLSPRLEKFIIPVVSEKELAPGEIFPDLSRLFEGKKAKFLLSWKTDKTDYVVGENGEMFLPGAGRDDFLTYEVIKLMVGKEFQYRDAIDISPATQRVIKVAEKIAQGGDSNLLDELKGMDVFEAPTDEALAQGAALAMRDPSFNSHDSIIFMEEHTASVQDMGSPINTILGLDVYNSCSGGLIVVSNVLYNAFQHFKMSLKTRLLAARDCVRIAAIFGRGPVILKLMLDMFSGIEGVDETLYELMMVFSFCASHYRKQI
jgi:hypothetical protein